MKGNLSRIIFIILEIIVGILLLINPVGFTTGIIMILGIILIVAGIVKVIQYFRATPEDAAKEKSLAMGLLAVLLGLWCALRSDWFIELFPVLTALYGVVLLICGVVKVQWTADLARARRKNWYCMAITALVTIVCAVLILYNPFASTEVMWTFTSITILVEAVLDILTLVFTRGSKASAE